MVILSGSGDVAAPTSAHSHCSYGVTFCLLLHSIVVLFGCCCESGVLMFGGSDDIQFALLCSDLAMFSQWYGMTGVETAVEETSTTFLLLCY